MSDPSADNIKCKIQSILDPHHPVECASCFHLKVTPVQFECAFRTQQIAFYGDGRRYRYMSRNSVQRHIATDVYCKGTVVQLSCYFSAVEGYLRVLGCFQYDLFQFFLNDAFLLRRKNVARLFQGGRGNGHLEGSRCDRVGRELSNPAKLARCYMVVMSFEPR